MHEEVDFSIPWTPSGVPLVGFWGHPGSLWGALGVIWVPLGICWVHVGIIFEAFSPGWFSDLFLERLGSDFAPFW